jgi:DNA-binding transcriptional ArsR family regulator
MSELTKAEFDLVSEILRAGELTRAAAFMVLVREKSNQDAIIKTGLSPQSLSNTLSRYRKMHIKISYVYAK